MPVGRLVDRPHDAGPPRRVVVPDDHAARAGHAKGVLRVVGDVLILMTAIDEDEPGRADVGSEVELLAVAEELSDATGLGRAAEARADRFARRLGLLRRDVAKGLRR